ncbi:crossover junction endodeoxyribonuclease RuvC [Glaciihabitans arcticus]|uniref:Crossover junction endodeoxyribonuclease RuvC n=1 Tax=Glaciihabitans arcticus TaxID=2668039 RepID=A0A4Q9GPQ8_9MICO|nr:crossover junction endodeoxyribonuclease RuvC [Glaciihabitans arcticus]TBN56786.1 crossover junction endodeoxyribonuclease RuvC [Glaciihabitans arcticus]
MSLRVLGIDPGLTRCGVGIVDVTATRKASLVHVEVIETPPDMPLERRLLIIGTGIARLLDAHEPHAVALERVFAQHNLRTVMGTAQASGVALHAAAARGLAVGLHTPSEVKAAVTGYGAADKKQVGTMVARILSLDAIPQPADAADALALAICHAWRTGGVAPARPGIAAASSLTPAQRAWRDAEKSAGVRRLGT